MRIVSAGRPKRSTIDAYEFAALVPHHAGTYACSSGIRALTMDSQDERTSQAPCTLGLGRASTSDTRPSVLVLRRKVLRRDDLQSAGCGVDATQAAGGAEGPTDGSKLTRPRPFLAPL